jgi:hypothetical protein
MQMPDDVYSNSRFASNDEQRLMMKVDKKLKIIDLLTRIRKKRQISNLKELNLYRVTYSRREALYQFLLISPDAYNSDIFGGS